MKKEIKIELEVVEDFNERNVRSLAELRERLFTQLDRVAEGKATAFDVGSTVALAHEITATIDKEIQVARFVGDELPEFILPTFSIGVKQ